jgi:hypothetical protein
MRIERIEARERGHAISGRVCCRFESPEATDTLELSHRGHIPYPVADLGQPDALLQVRDHPDARPSTIAREEWSFVDATHVRLPSGFEPGRFYELVYTATGAVLTGLGVAATRDAAAHLRPDYDAVYAYGASQSGGFLRTLLHLGCDRDEEGDTAFDGLLAHIAGAFHGEINWRFGQPSYFGPYSLSYTPPLADGELFDSPHRRGEPPKVMFFDTSAEYWSLYGALCHTSPDGRRDLPQPESARRYHAAGTQHGSAIFPPTNRLEAPVAVSAALPFNTVDYRPMLRAALVNLDGWARDQLAPPPSRHPRIADGSLVSAEAALDALRAVPGTEPPVHVPRLGPLDYGEQADSGRATRLPPVVGQRYPLLVPAVDADGNEIGGLRPPDVEVPVATHTGWNAHAPEGPAAGQLATLFGASIPFPVTTAARERARDPRPSIEERYASRDDYLTRLRGAAEQLVAARYLLPDDVVNIVAAGSQRYEHAAAHRV